MITEPQFVFYVVAMTVGFLIVVTGAVLHMHRKGLVRWPSRCNAVDAEQGHEMVETSARNSVATTNTNAPGTAVTDANTARREPRRFGGKKDFQPLKLVDSMRAEIDLDARKRTDHAARDCGLP
jgi:hypothetical protein